MVLRADEQRAWGALIIHPMLTPGEGVRQEGGGSLGTGKRTCFPREPHGDWENSYRGAQAVQPGHWPLLLAHHASCYPC